MWRSMTLKIRDRAIGANAPCYVIAEAGSNHNRDFAQAKVLVEVAAEAGADAVKFQTFKAHSMYPRDSRPVDYLVEKGITSSIYEVIRETEMPDEWIPELAALCDDLDIHFLSTAFDEASVDSLSPYVPAFKIASYELTHLPLIQHAARFGRPMIMSTGVASMDDIEDAVGAVRDAGNQSICLMQCTAKYPAPLDTINIAAIPILREAFGVPVGLSDHSSHPTAAPCAAAAVGAAVVEKHFTLSRHLPGPDHAFALEPEELQEMVQSIRRTEIAMGQSKKEVQDIEKELYDYRRGIYTTRALHRGHELRADDLVILRRAGAPDTGLQPRDLSTVTGRAISQDVEAHHLLGPEDLEP